MAGTLIISLDFELFWGMLDVCPLETYQDHVLGGRKAIPGLLAMIFGWIYGVFCSSICSWGWHIMAFYALRYVESALRCWHCWQWFPGIPFPSCPMLPGRGLLFIA